MVACRINLSASRHTCVNTIADFVAPYYRLCPRRNSFSNSLFTLKTWVSSWNSSRNCTHIRFKRNYCPKCLTMNLHVRWRPYVNFRWWAQRSLIDNKNNTERSEGWRTYFRKLSLNIIRLPIEWIGILKFHKIAAQWVPTEYNAAQKQKHISISRELLSRHRSQKWEYLARIVTGDETWIEWSMPETKRQSSEWRHANSPRIKKSKKELRAKKTMATIFWDHKGIIMAEFLKQETTVNADRIFRPQISCEPCWNERDPVFSLSFCSIQR